MKKMTIGLVIASVLILIIIFLIFRQETVSVGRYQVTYYTRSNVDPKSLPQDLGSLQQISGLVRITWQEQIGSEMYQEYCYLPGKGVEQGRLIHRK